MSEKRKVKFLKDHVNGIKEADTGPIVIGKADYLVREGIAEYADQKEIKVKKAVKEMPCKTC